jgi:hypothetical protein
MGGYSSRRLNAITAVSNRFVVSTNMFNGAYTIANPSSADGRARNVTVLQTIVATGTDTPGTVLVTGTNVDGKVQTETLTPVGGSTVSGVLPFQTVTSIVGSGWVIAGGNDTIVFGTGLMCGISAHTGVLHTVVIGTTAAAAITIADALGTIAVLASNIANSTPLRYDVPFVGRLTFNVGGASDLTVTYRN